MQTQSNEQYWRDRYGMPPRVEEQQTSRVIQMPRRNAHGFATPLKARRLHFSPRPSPWMRKNARRALMPILKVSAVALFAVWVASSNAIFPPPAERVQAGLPSAISAAMTVAPDDGTTATAIPADSAEDRMARFASAQETSLVALRGYLLTGSPGFKAEWTQASADAEILQSAIEQDSRSWTDGGRLLQLSEMRKTTETLRAEEKMLISIIATPNQFPGLRVYREDVDPALTQIIVHLDQAVQSALAARGKAAAESVGILANVRGDVRDLREKLPTYLISGDAPLPDELQASLAKFRATSVALQKLQAGAAQRDRERLVQLGRLLQTTDTRLGQILALKQSPRWDYADYSFKQKVLPLAEKILRTVRGWQQSTS